MLAAGGQQGEDTTLARPHQADRTGETGTGITHRVPDVPDHVVEGEPADDPGTAPVGQRVDADHVVAVPADRIKEGAVEQGVGHGAWDEHDRRRRVLLGLPDGQRDGGPARLDRDLRVAGKLDRVLFQQCCDAHASYALSKLSALLTDSVGASRKPASMP